jgi:hypothetical protein
MATVAVSVLGADGTLHMLGALELTITIEAVKHKVSEASGVRIGGQQLFEIDGEDGLELQNCSTLAEVQQGSPTELNLAMISTSYGEF